MNRPLENCYLRLFLSYFVLFFNAGMGKKGNVPQDGLIFFLLHTSQHFKMRKKLTKP